MVSARFSPLISISFIVTMGTAVVPLFAALSDRIAEWASVI